MAAGSVADEVTMIWQVQRSSVNLKERKNIVWAIKHLHSKYFKISRNANRPGNMQNEKQADFEAILKDEYDIGNKANISDDSESSDSNSHAAQKQPSSKSSSSMNESETDTNFEQQDKRSKQKLQISAQLVGSLDHAGLSNANATSIILSSAHFLGYNLSEVNVSKSTLRRRRIQIRKTIANEIRVTFGDNVNKYFLVLHWDGKILPKFHSVDGKTDRLAVVVSCRKMSKVLGVAELQRGTGLAQYESIEDQLRDWNIEDKIKGICFDTTSTNTGEKSGTCHRLQQKYDNNILSLACRHHMLELIVGAAYTTSLDDKSQSPEIGLFVRFKTKWNDFNQSRILNGIEITKISNSIAKRTRKRQAGCIYSKSNRNPKFIAHGLLIISGIMPIVLGRESD